MVNFCAIVGCAMRADRDVGRSFFRIPAVVTRQGEQTREVSQRRRDGWLSRISRADVKESSIKYMRVCDLHFVSGHPSDMFPPDTTDWLPSLNLGHNEVPTPPPGAPARAVHHRNRKRRKVLEAAESLVALQTVSSSDCATGGCEPMEDHKYMRQPEEEETGQACQTELTGALIAGMQDEINRLAAENLELKKQLAAAYAQHLPVQVMDYFFPNAVSKDSCPHPGPQEKELPQHHGYRETEFFKKEPNCWDGPDPSQIKEEPEELELQHFKQEQEEPGPPQMEEHEEHDTGQEGERLTLKLEVLEYMGQPVVQLQLLDDHSTAGEAAPPSPPSNTSVAPPGGPASQSAQSNPSSPSQAEG